MQIWIKYCGFADTRKISLRCFSVYVNHLHIAILQMKLPNYVNYPTYKPMLSVDDFHKLTLLLSKNEHIHNIFVVISNIQGFMQNCF